jgi:hypothetical protein
MRPHPSPGAPVASTAPAEAKPAFAQALRGGVVATVVLLVVLMAIGVAHMFLAPDRKGLTDFFFFEQDLVVVGPMIFLLVALAFPWPWRLPLKPPPATWRTAMLIALAVTVAGWAGSYLAYDDYALSMDEFMARFDAQILATGQLAAPVPPEWRAYVKALQPLFMLDIPGHARWVSGYLPVNAAFLALGLKLGAMNLVPALWAGISIIATFGVARRLWPEKPGAALIAVGLLATSAQLIVTAMTPYAMSAHLALNMVWLWLYLRGGRLGHGAAAGVAFLATGLHQIVFHPLFAAPFVLELWLERRWKPALWHTCAYAVIGAFWALYQPMLVHLYGAGTAAAAAQGGGALTTLAYLLASFDLAGLGYLAKNCVRLITWQNLLLAPLVLIAIGPALRERGPVRAMALGLAATLAMLVVVMPYQGHGWGYRYLHGLLGSLCLLAAWAWTSLSEGTAGDPAPRRAIFACGLAASAALALPLRALQAHDFEHPYAVAVREIQTIDADIVIVDDYGLWFGADLVRNRPTLANRPLVVRASALSGDQLRSLCARGKAVWFKPEDAARAGVRRTPAPRPAQAVQGCPAAA